MSGLVVLVLALRTYGPYAIAVLHVGYKHSPKSCVQRQERKLPHYFVFPQALWTVFYAGSAVGCLLWLFLSKGIPPNLLMASAQLLNLGTSYRGFGLVIE